nr:SurA N-terminal domain-containing protein [Acidobacteriota bacterium]
MKRTERQLRKILIALGLLVLVFINFSIDAKAQDVVDKTVATVGDGVGVPELITFSDLLWQLALQPGTPLRPPSSEDLNRALQLLINQRLFALEAKRVPRSAPTQAEIDAKIKDV